MSGRVVSDIQTRASGCISDTTRMRMLYIAYDTPTSKCSCISTILKFFFYPSKSKLMFK